MASEPQQLDLFADWGHLVKMREVEKHIDRHKLIVPRPNRTTLIAWGEQGLYEITKIGKDYFIHTESFARYIRSLWPPGYQLPVAVQRQVSWKS